MKNIAILKVTVLCVTICVLILRMPVTAAQEIEPTARHDTGNIESITPTPGMLRLDGNDKNTWLIVPEQSPHLDGEGEFGGSQTDDGENRCSAAKWVNGVLVELTPQELTEFNRKLYNTKSYDEYMALMATLAYYNNGVNMTKFSWWDETEKNVGFVVPDVIGMTVPQAYKTMTDAGFGVNVIYKYSAESTLPLGYCYAQEIPAGKRSSTTGFKIFIQAQEKIQTNENLPGYDSLVVTIPDVVGMSESAALSALRNSGLSNISVLYQEERNGTKLGFCYAQNIAAGQMLPHNTNITICIQSTDYFRTVPNVVGMHHDKAVALLRSLGFNVSWTFDDDPAKGLPINYCIAQSIKAGTNTDKEYIKLTLQNYVTPVEDPQPTVTPSQEPQPTATLSQEPQPTATPS